MVELSELSPFTHKLSSSLLLGSCSRTELGLAYELVSSWAEPTSSKFFIFYFQIFGTFLFTCFTSPWPELVGSWTLGLLAQPTTCSRGRWVETCSAHWANPGSARASPQTRSSCPLAEFWRAKPMNYSTLLSPLNQYTTIIVAYTISCQEVMEGFHGKLKLKFESNNSLIYISSF